ncbi:MAG: hemerythrin domain-containing protein [Opitutales bacterium]
MKIDTQSTLDPEETLAECLRKYPRFQTVFKNLGIDLGAHAGDSSEPGGSTLFKIQERLTQFREGMTKHLREETEVFFPLIRQLGNSRAARTGAFDLLKSLLAEMRHEHSEMDEALAELEMLIDGYGQTFAHPNHQALRDRLNDLQETLQVQIYQENQILFRRVLAALGSHKGDEDNG